jgi:hypothetical protein
LGKLRQLTILKCRLQNAASQIKRAFDDDRAGLVCLSLIISVSSTTLHQAQLTAQPQGYQVLNK